MINRQRNATNRLAESVWNRNNNIAEPAKSAETNNASYENDALEKQRNATNRLAESVWNRNNNTAAVPAVPEVPNTKNNNSAPAAMPKRTYKPYDANTDYTTLINDAVKSGNYALAAEYERLRNLKIGDMGLPYEVTDNFNYIDRNGYGGEADRLYNAIEQYNRDGFNYDYKSDPRYQQILAQQKKEAEAQFENGLAELSQRFGGDVPANLIGGLLKTSQDTIDAADNYIPQLWQMAQDMWMNEGNQLYNQYNLASMRASDDYNKWAIDREFYTQGFENKYGRGIDERNFNEDVRRNNRDFDWTEKTDTRNFNEDVRRNNRDFDWTEKTDTRNFNEDVRRNNRDFDWTEKTDTRNFNEDVRRNNRDFDWTEKTDTRNFDWTKNMDLLNFKENAWRYNNEHRIKGGIERPTIPTVEEINAVGDTIVNIMEKAIEAGFSEEEAYDVAASVVTETIAPANAPKSTDKTKETSGKVFIDEDGNIVFKKK